MYNCKTQFWLPAVETPFGLLLRRTLVHFVRYGTIYLRANVTL